MRRLAAAVVAAGAVAAAVIWLIFGRSPGAGPFGGWPGGYGCNTFGLVLKPGQLVEVDYPLVVDPPFPKPLSVPVELLGVRLLHPADGNGVAVRYGARADDPVERVGRSGWKPQAWHMRPVPGFVIPAHHQGMLMIGVSSKQLGIHHICGVVLDYRIGGTTYSAAQAVGIDVTVKKHGLAFGKNRRR